MILSRRKFMVLAGAAAVRDFVVSTPSALSVTIPKIKAIAFDGLTIFDPRPVYALAEGLFPEKGGELSNVWRTRQFEYTWLRTLTGQYTDFWHVTEDALVYAAKLVMVELTAEKRNQLMKAFLNISAWPDALPTLQWLKSAGMKLALLSNFTQAMLDAAVRSSGLQGIFEPHLSTDKVKAYKPAPRAYQIGIDAFGVKREEIAFAAFGGWDAAGAKAFGYPTFWVNRMNLPLEELSFAPDAIGATLRDLVSFVGRVGTVPLI
jgi:2-haloacid dehalogenase